MKPCPPEESWKLIETAVISLIITVGGKMTKMGWVHVHSTSKRVELDSPGYSGFEKKLKQFQILSNRDFLAQYVRNYVHMSPTYIFAFVLIFLFIACYGRPSPLFLAFIVWGPARRSSGLLTFCPRPPTSSSSHDEHEKTFYWQEYPFCISSKITYSWNNFAYL